MEIYTTGFTKKSAERFFGELEAAQVRHLVDVRLRNVSQLAGFTKATDFTYFLARLSGVTYLHEVSLAPTAELLDAYRHRLLKWSEYAARFLALMEERQIHKIISPELFTERTVLLCSELRPDRCHRRLVAEFLRERWPNVAIMHL